MKTIVCFGDSNTWGYCPETQTRYGREERWTGILRNRLGEDFQIIEEGLNGRTTVWDDPIEGYKNGKEQIIPCLESHKPLDLVILMLGTNDLKNRFSVTGGEIAKGAGSLVKIIQKLESGIKGAPPKVLLMAPPPIIETDVFGDAFFGGKKKSERFSEEYAKVASQRECAFLDTGTIIHSSPVDGIHFDIKEHRILGEAVAKKIREIL